MFGSGGTGFGGFGQQNNQQQQQQQPGQQPQTGGLFGTPQQQQPQQGAAGAGFGGFGSQPSTFGAGAANTGGGGGLFGQQAQQQQQQPASSGFTFGQNTTATPFGQTPQQNQARPGGFGGFGAAASTPAQPSSGFGGFGASANTQTPAFGATPATNNAFGAKPAGGGLFGQPAQSNTGAFQPQGANLFGGGGNGLGAAQTGGMPTQGTSNPPYQPFVNAEKDATGSGSTNYQYASITCLPAYRAASLEELRLQDYQQGRKTGNAGPGTMGGFGQSNLGGGFGSAQPATGGGLFGQQQQQQQPQQAQTGFGASSSGGLFGQNNQQPQQPQSGGLFGAQNTGGGGLFGQQQTQPQQSGGLFGQNNATQPQATSSFSFGQPAQQTNTSSGFTFGQNNQQNKPAGTGAFGSTNTGGFGSSGSSGFTFGANNNQQQQPAQGTGFGASSSGGFGFGTQAQSNQPKPGGLFGGTTSAAPAFGGFGAPATSQPEANKSFSFGGFGAGASTAPGQTNPTAPTGGLFGNAGQQQPTTTSQPAGGFSFGGSNTQQPAAGTSLFGNAKPTGFESGGLFGQQKPATGGLFGQQTQSQPQSGQPSGGAGGFNFGSAASGSANTGSSLFGNNASKPGGLFGGGGAFGGASQPAASGGGLFGNASAPAPQAGGGLFGSSQPNQTSSLFGSNQQGAAGQSGSGLGRGLFGASNTAGASGGSLFGQPLGGQQSSLFGGQAQNQQAANLQASLTSNPYGTDSLFGGQAAAAVPGTTLGASGGSLSPQPYLPFNVARPSAKKQAPIVPPFRPSIRGPASARVAKLRGSTPSAFREGGTPAREGSPSLYSQSPSANRLASPGAGGNLFRGLSDEMPRQQREASTPAPLPPQAFYSRPSVKRLVLDDSTNRSTPAAARTASLFGSRASSTVRGESPAPGSASAMRSTAPLFERGTTPASARITFSPALETSATARAGSHRHVADETIGDDTFAGNLLGGRRNLRSINESPSKADSSADTSLPALGAKSTISSPPNVSHKEDALLPLDYYTSPPLSELREWSHAELRAVEGFKVGRKGFGSVEFIEPVDLTTVGELSNVPGGIVQLRRKECFVYPDEEDCFDADTGKERDGVQPGFDPQRVPGGKAKQGQGLNVPAIVKLERCWPLDRSTREPITDGEHIRVKQLVNKLKRRADLTFKDYEPVSGTWSFRVEHFSRYGLDEDDDSDDADGAADHAHSQKKAEGRAEAISAKNTKRRVADDQDAAAPPIRSLDDVEQDAEHVDGADMPLSNVKSEKGTGRLLGELVAAPRASTPALKNIVGQSQQPAQKGTQPWAASLGLEPKRIHVMQASFFGGAESPKKLRADGDEKTTSFASTKKARPGSALPENKFTTQRSTFAKPAVSAISSTYSRSKSVAAEGDADVSEARDLSLLPPTLARPNKVTKIELSSSVTGDAHGIALDAGLSMGHSFRVGWGPDGTFAHRCRTIGTSSKDVQNDALGSGSAAAVIDKLHIYRKSEEARERSKLVTLLKTQFEHASVEVDDDECPVVYPNEDLRFHHFAKALDTDEAARYDSAVFQLASALFDEVDLKLPTLRDEPVDRAVEAELTRIRRKNNVANWIRWYTGELIRNEVRSQLASPAKSSGEQIIFSHLTGGFVEDACKHAIDIGDVRLATLIAQAEGGGSEDEYRLDLLDQLSIWRAGGADTFMSPDYRRVLELLSGNVLFSRGNGKRDAADRVEDVVIAGGLDWVRTFSLFLHYDQRFEAGLEDSVAAYEASIGMGEGDSIVTPPLPPYLESNVKPGSKRFRDLVKSGNYSRDACFALLKLFSQPNEYAVENLAEPLSYGPYKCSYTVPFFLVQIFTKVLRIRDFSDRVDLGIEAGILARDSLVQGNSARSDNLCVSFAMQAEMIGEWTWAAFILLHLEMSSSRREAIVALLSRNVHKLVSSTVSERSHSWATAPFSATSDHLELSNDSQFLVNELKIPRSWIYAALADQAGWRQDRFAQYRLLLKADSYARAHDIAVSYLAPEAIIRHDHALLLDLFAPFRGRSDAEQDGEMGDGAGLRAEMEVPGWSAGGQVFLDYVAMCTTLHHLVVSHAPSLASAADSIKAAQREASDESLEATLSLIEDIVGAEAAVAARRIDRMARRIASLVQRVSDLFDGAAGGRGDPTTMMVARSQMIASLHNCARSLTGTRTMVRVAALLPSLAVDLDVDVQQRKQAALDVEASRGTAADAPPIQVESLHFMANAYCDALIIAGGP